jgi:uncharacterized PurR-regulated membrane protein YhhQ (DUF165 family)
MSTQDRWLLPRHQTEYPARELVSEGKLHARREATFLTLAAVVLVATTALVLLGTSRILELSPWIEQVAPDISLGVALALPFGMLAGSSAFAAALLTCELYGRRRAASLVWASIVAAGAIIGVARLADFAAGNGALFDGAVACASYLAFGQLAQLVIFDAMRVRARGRRFALRAIVATVFAQAVAATAFGATLYELADPPDLVRITGLALGAGAYGVALGLVLLIPLAIAARSLSLYLRVARLFADADTDSAHVERTGPRPQAVSERRQRRAARATLQPFSHAELRFFSEGDELHLEPVPE